MTNRNHSNKNAVRAASQARPPAAPGVGPEIRFSGAHRSKKRHHAALGARWLTAGLATSGTLGMLTYLQIQDATAQSVTTAVLPAPTSSTTSAAPITAPPPAPVITVVPASKKHRIAQPVPAVVPQTVPRTVPPTVYQNPVYTPQPQYVPPATHARSSGSAP